jgi:hypothetical protein
MLIGHNRYDTCRRSKAGGVRRSRYDRGKTHVEPLRGEAAFGGLFPFWEKVSALRAISAPTDVLPSSGRAPSWRLTGSQGWKPTALNPTGFLREIEAGFRNGPRPAGFHLSIPPPCTSCVQHGICRPWTELSHFAPPLRLTMLLASIHGD